jgi:hypothetical protein
MLLVSILVGNSARIIQVTLSSEFQLSKGAIAYEKTVTA